MKTIRIYHLILCVLGLMVSCETRTKLVNHKEQEIIKTIRINFHDNILQLNPIKAESRSEQFVKDLVFDPFIEKDLSSHLFETYQVDSPLGLYTFQLEQDKSFHDGTPVNSDAIKNFFKYMLKNHYDDEYVHLLFSSMDGFGPISWYRENRGIKDSIPSGFQVIDQTSFSIQLRTNKDKLLDWFQSPIFTLFKESSGTYIGSGDFELKNLNEDISAKLVRRIPDNHKIETIQLSFIKNEDLVYSEFFRGALDIILYQPSRSKLTPQTKRLNKILNSQYPDYQISQSEKSILKFMEFKLLTDSILLHKVLASIKSKREESIDINNEISQDLYNVDSLAEISLDTSYHHIQWYSELSSDSSQYFTNTPYLEFVETNHENINPTQPQIVIREVEVEFWPRNIKILSNNELAQELKGDNNSVILILESFPEYVIYNNKLNGINTNTSFSNMVRNAYYQEIETY